MSPRHRTRWWSALEPIIDDVTDALRRRRTEFVLPGENRVAAALDLARTIVRRAERAGRRRHPRAGWLDPTSQVVPYLNRLADLVYTLARWQEGNTSRPVSADPSRRRFAEYAARDP